VPVASGYIKGRHIPEFDGIRGMAVTLVIIAHFFPFLGPTTDIGWISVDSFFVLSGYLITNILISSRHQKKYFRNFYARRVLRVFPVYYFLLIVTLFILPLVLRSLPAGYDYFLKNRIFYFAYLQNSLFQRDGWPPAWMLSHLWSLAIEEQFYILWPLFVFFLPNRWLLVVTSLMISISIALRFSNPDILYAYFSTPTRIDAILVGCSLAILLLEKPRVVEQIALPLFILILALVIIAFYRTYWQLSYQNHHMKRWGYTVVDIGWAALLVICMSAAKKISWVGRMFRVRILTFLGKYSYGIYLYHMVLFFLLGEWISMAWKWVGVRAEGIFNWPVGLTILTITLMISYLSYRFLETPFLRLKKYFAH
jgi:peptidoglycan/LPS O-acetylase OafA/YrhL